MIATSSAGSIFPRHSQVDHHHIGQLPCWRRSYQLKGFSGGTGGDHACAVLRKRRLKQFARVIRVINHQRSGVGRLNMKGVEANIPGALASQYE